MNRSFRGSVNREILKLAIPSILANITVPLVGMVDIAVAGHLSAQAAAVIGGISIGSMLFDLLYWNFGFLRVGTGGLTAQAYGRQDWGNCATQLGRSLALSWIIALGLIAIQWLFVQFAFLFVSCSEEVRGLASQYFYIRIWAAPATLGLMAFKGWFIGMQDSLSSMITDLVVNGINILGSLVLALGLRPLQAWFPQEVLWSGMGFPGIALGTVLAQYSGLLTAFLLTAFRHRSVVAGLRLSHALRALRSDDTRQFTKMNADLFVRSLCFICIYIGYTVISARYGDLLLASASILMKLLMLFSYFTDGFAYAGEALTGKYIGAGDRRSLTESIRWVFVWSLGISLLFVGIYYLSGVPLLRLMTGDAEVIAACRPFLIWLLPMPVFGCIAFTCDGIYVGATASRAIRNTMLWSVLAFFGVWAAGCLLLRQLCPDCGGQTFIHLLLGAYFAHLLARSVYQTLHFRKAVYGA